MCGIGGIVRITPPGEPFEPIPEAWADALDTHIAWRGPDGAGRFRDKVERTDGSIVEVVLVHRRLSIIDHEGGAQPMVWRGPGGPAGGPARRAGSLVTTGRVEDPARRAGPPAGDNLIALVFNGCIYNHRELRAELEADGALFTTDHSDTEVILAHHVASRGSSVDDLPPIPLGWLVDTPPQAMHAALLWDRALDYIAGSRDAFGEKPLYKWSDGRRVAAAASTVPAIDSIRRAVGAAPAIDRATLVAWLALGSHAHSPRGVLATSRDEVSIIAPPDLPFKRGWSIRGALEWVWLFPVMLIAIAMTVVFVPALVVVLLVRSWAKGTLSRTADATNGPTRRTRRVDELHQLLSTSIANRLDADVPIGCFLSGGIDSSLIAYYANQARPGITTLCMRMPDERYDESEHAQRVADILGTNHITVDCAQDPAGDLVHIIETLGLPFGDSSILPTYWLCKAARQHIKVALSGDGGDELFMGYERHRVAGLLRWAMLPAMFYHPRLDETDPTSRSSKKARFLRAARGRGYADLVSIFDSTDLRRLIRGKRKGTGAMDQVYGRAAARRWDLAHYLPDDLLRKTDTASMLCGLEVRAPFLDSAVANFALSLPPRVHLARRETKHLLRELARRHFPPEVTHRPKQGFAIPIGQWFRTDRGGMRTLLRERLAGPEPFGIAHQALDFNMDYVHQMLDEDDEAGRGGGAAPSGTRGRDHSQRLYMLLVLAIWGQAEARLVRRE